MCTRTRNGWKYNSGVISVGLGDNGTFLSADSEATGIETGVGIDKEFDRKTTSQTKLAEQQVLDSSAWSGEQEE